MYNKRDRVDLLAAEDNSRVSGGPGYGAAVCGVNA